MMRVFYFFFALKMEVAASSEMLVPVKQTKWHQVPEDYDVGKYFSCHKMVDQYFLVPCCVWPLLSPQDSLITFLVLVLKTCGPGMKLNLKKEINFHELTVMFILISLDNFHCFLCCKWPNDIARIRKTDSWLPSGKLVASQNCLTPATVFFYNYIICELKQHH